MSHLVCTNLHCRPFARLGSAGLIMQSALTGLAEQNLVCRRHAYCQAKHKYRVCGRAYRAVQVNMLMAVRFTHADYCLLFRFKPADRGQSPWYMHTPMWPTKTRLWACWQSSMGNHPSPLSCQTPARVICSMQPTGSKSQHTLTPFPWPTCTCTSPY